ncbi:MAG: hypothetical protein IPJ69_00190 [Deltaproteobacteria bacterium]|nr:MAG: hypothetical protein IPJ69_00190 [Deltaproteobacteria bacterium]
MKFREKITIKNVSLERELIFLMGARAPEESAKLSISDQVFMAAESIAETPQIYVSYPKELKTSLMPHVAHLPWLAEEAYEGIRVRGRFPKYGIDIDENQILLESPIPVAYKRQKGCYPGQEVIERISAYGKGRTPTTLCLLSCEGQHDFSASSPLLSGDQAAGHITSCVFDPLTEKTWVLGYVEQKFIAPNMEFQISSQKAELFFD